MEKNTIVLDELGNRIGTTYPKRAKGLIKSGRAEYVDDHTIRIQTTHAPTILIDQINNMEDKIMSKVIDFNARDFRFDETNQGKNTGSRMFITDMFDKATEIFEIGGPGCWTQICADKVLERETDYIFRFGVTRDGFGDSASRFILVPNDNWDDRFVFNLTGDQFKPTAIKKWNGKDFRIYEIPFNTGHIENYRFVIVEFMTSARIFPVRELEAYSILEDSTGESSRFTMPNFDNFKADFSDFGKSAGEAVKNAFSKLSETFSSSSESRSFGEHRNHGYNKSGAAVSPWDLKNAFDSIGDGGSFSFDGCSLGSFDGTIDWGCSFDGVTFDAEGCSISAQSLDGIIKKLGDGSDLMLRGCNISYAGYEDGQISVSDGINIDLSGSNLSADAFAYIIRKVGDGSKINMGGAIIRGEHTSADFGGPVDGVKFIQDNADIPDFIIDKLKSKFGESCSWH